MSENNEVVENGTGHGWGSNIRGGIVGQLDRVCEPIKNDDVADQSEGTTATSRSEEPRSRHHVQHDGEGSLSMTVIEALAEAKGVSPATIEEPLYETVDPDALDRLFVASDTDGTGRLVFSAEGCEVTVHSDGQIYVREG